jgi:hypothetical protein
VKQVSTAQWWGIVAVLLACGYTQWYGVWLWRRGERLACAGLTLLCGSAVIAALTQTLTWI